MKDYIIDLDLEFGLRIRVAVAETIQPGPKINEREREGHFGHCARTPLPPSPARDTPRFSLSSLSLLLCFSLLLSSVINAVPKLKAPAIFVPHNLKFHPFDLPYELATVGRDFGQNSEHT